MKTHVVGIDIAKETLDWHVYGTEDHGQVANTPTGIQTLLRSIRGLKIALEHCWFCFEHTGTYGLLLASILQAEELTYTIVPALQIKQSLGMVRGKNDRVDAQRIARYAQLHLEELKPSQMPSQTILKVKHLLTHRQQLVKTATQEKNSLKALKPVQGLVDVALIEQSKQKHLEMLRLEIKTIDEAIQTTLAEDKQIKSNMSLLRSIKGIGPMIAAYLIVTTGNFTLFDSARQYNCYTGIAPFEHTSGISVRGPSRVSPLGNKTMKALLYNGAHSAALSDPEMAAYTQRKLAENKHRQSVMNAVACKLVGRAFAVIKRGTPYVVTYQQKIS